MAKLRAVSLNANIMARWLDKSHRTKEQELQQAQVQTVKNSTTLNKTIGGLILVFIIITNFNKGLYWLR